ncbi:MAG: hypothetical protein PWP76_617 [Candidatus Diapherotrites archaeon]|nr:hypothetical protein [Candidatus Diapherotrites archaeon]
MDLLDIGLVLIILGMLFIAIGILGVPASEKRVEGAAVVFIGPIPLVVANSERAAIIALLAALALIAMVILWLRA